MSDEEGAITATIKGGKGYEAPWLVFRGSSAAEVQARISEAFGLEAQGETLCSTVLAASEAMQSEGVVVRSLGGRTLSTAQERAEASGHPSARSAQTAPPAPERPPLRVVDEGADDPVAQVRQAIEEANSTTALQRVWGRHKAVMSQSPDLIEAYKTRGRTLRDSGK